MHAESLGADAIAVTRLRPASSSARPPEESASRSTHSFPRRPRIVSNEERSRGPLTRYSTAGRRMVRASLKPRDRASCHDLTAKNSLRPPSPMSSRAARKSMSPAIFRSQPSSTIPRKIDSASATSPSRAMARARTAKRNDRPRCVTSPDTTRGGFAGVGAFFSAAAYATAWSAGSAPKRGSITEVRFAAAPRIARLRGATPDIRS